MRRSWFHGPKPVVAYVDAAGCVRLGVTIFSADQVSTFPIHIPGRLIQSECDIFDMEMRACLFEMCIAAELFPNRCALLRCDNRGATGTLVRGACWPTISLGICAAFWALAASRMIPVWIEEVPGKLNPADPLPGIAPFANSLFV